jgi:hypothetical protein
MSKISDCAELAPRYGVGTDQVGADQFAQERDDVEAVCREEPHLERNGFPLEAAFVIALAP